MANIKTREELVDKYADGKDVVFVDAEELKIYQDQGYKTIKNENGGIVTDRGDPLLVRP